MLIVTEWLILWAFIVMATFVVVFSMECRYKVGILDSQQANIGHAYFCMGHLMTLAVQCMVFSLPESVDQDSSISYLWKYSRWVWVILELLLGILLHNGLNFSGMKPKVSPFSHFLRT